MVENDFASAQRDLVNALSKFIFGPFFQPFMACMWAASMGLVIYGIVTADWLNYVLPGVLMANVYGYFAVRGVPKN